MPAKGFRLKPDLLERGLHIAVTRNSVWIILPRPIDRLCARLFNQLLQGFQCTRIAAQGQAASRFGQRRAMMLKPKPHAKFGRCRKCVVLLVENEHWDHRPPCRTGRMKGGMIAQPKITAQPQQNGGCIAQCCRLY